MFGNRNNSGSTNPNDDMKKHPYLFVFTSPVANSTGAVGLVRFDASCSVAFATPVALAGIDLVVTVFFVKMRTQTRERGCFLSCRS